MSIEDFEDWLENTVMCRLHSWLYFCPCSLLTTRSDTGRKPGGRGYILLPVVSPSLSIYGMVLRMSEECCAHFPIYGCSTDTAEVEEYINKQGRFILYSK
jgi:hypothetical protein